jgi:uncharacterized protein YecE (DUF72 family)
MAVKRELSGLFIGTSGWSYNHWSGIFYPEDIKPVQYLEYYITKFHCVELNSSFYHLPLKATVKGWIRRTPEEFRFCPKLSRFITHQKRLVNIEEPLEKFFDVIDEMKMKLGPILIQLPPGLKFDKYLASDFIDIITENDKNLRFAIEVRNKSWISDDFFQLLSRGNMAFVIADSGNRFPFYETVTADFVYLRLHGPENLYASDYTESDLQNWARKITRWLKENKEVWTFFNNDYGGYAVKNARKLIEIINNTV